MLAGRPPRTSHASGIRFRERRRRSDLVRQYREFRASPRGPGRGCAALCRNREVRAEARPVAAAAGSRRRAFRRAVRSGSRRQGRQGPLPAGPPARPAAGRHLSLCERAARHAAWLPRLRARVLQVHPLPQGGAERRAACHPRGHRWRGAFAHRRGRGARARPHQHARERPRAGRAGRGRARPRHKAWRQHPTRSSATTC